MARTIQRALIAVILASGLLAGCGQSVEDPRELQMQVVHGVALYGERLPLSNQARLIAELRDTSEEGSGRLVSEEELAPPGQFPFRFELRFSPAEVTPESQLMLEVRVYEGAELLFMNEPMLPLDRRNTTDVLEITMAPTEAGEMHLAAWRQRREAEAEAGTQPAAPAFELPPPPDLDFDTEEEIETPAEPEPGQ